jgi:hypothetical protein
MASQIAKIIAFTGAVKAKTFKIGVFSDLHLQPNYQPNISPS